MREHRIYHDGALVPGQAARLDDAAAAHVARVLRLKAGDTLILFNGDGRDYPAVITAAGRGRVEATVGDGRPAGTESPLALTLLQGVCRGQRMDTVIQKATELGVAAIVPVLCERSVVRLPGERAGRRADHWRRVAAGACEQSGRAVLPAVAEAAPLDRALAGVDASLRLLLDPDGRQGIAPAPPAGGIALLVGPEGGLTAAELALAQASGFVAVRLGPRVLRTETAPLVALGILQYLFGDAGA